MTWQPALSIPLASQPFSWWRPASCQSILGCCPPISFSVCLAFSLLVLCLEYLVTCLYHFINVGVCIYIYNIYIYIYIYIYIINITGSHTESKDTLDTSCNFLFKIKPDKFLSQWAYKSYTMIWFLFVDLLPRDSQILFLKVHYLHHVYCKYKNTDVTKMVK